MAQAELQTQDLDSISERLKDIPLKLPRSVGEEPGAEAKRTYLKRLLKRDPDVFLERHGTDLTPRERALFEPLRPDSFEVDFYMRRLEDDRTISNAPTPAVVRNRRLAKLNRLTADDFFSEACRLMGNPSSNHNLKQRVNYECFTFGDVILEGPHHDVLCLQAAMRSRAPDLADQYIGVSKQPELVANSTSQGDMLDRLGKLPKPSSPAGVLVRQSAETS